MVYELYGITRKEITVMERREWSSNLMPNGGQDAEKT